MRYMIFGAGRDGARAYEFFGGSHRVDCFIDNKKAGSFFGDDGTEIISVAEARERAGSHIIIIASEKYFPEMAAQLEKEGISGFFVFRAYAISDMKYTLPNYFIYGKPNHMYYDEILSSHGISAYKRIAIYGINHYICYLIAEIAYQNDIKNIVAIVDEKSKPGHIMGIPVRKDTEGLYGEIDCLIVNSKRPESPIRDDLPKGCKFALIDIYDIDGFIPCYRYPKLKKYKGIHKGERCFIIGNGPSLTIEDLETLHRHGDICFGVNSVWKAYDRTNWRPDYLTISDEKAIVAAWAALDGMDGKVFLADAYHFSSCKKKHGGNIEYVHRRWPSDFYPNYPGFAKDITEGFYLGFSVVYDMALQIAAYMGFSAIYLVGVDNSYSSNPKEPGNHFIRDYHDGESKVNDSRPEAVVRAFEKAEQYSREHGFRIYNATRGGKLEVFERVSLDSLFES